MNSIVSHENSSDTMISKYEDELKFLIRDEEQLCAVYNFAKDYLGNFFCTEKIQIDNYLDDSDLTLHKCGVSLRVRQSESSGASKSSLDLKMKLLSTDGNETGIYRRREAKKPISDDQKDALVNGSSIENVDPEFYKMLCDLVCLQSVDLAVKFELHTKRSVLSATVDSSTQITLNFDVIRYDSLHTYFELEIKYTTAARQIPEIVESIRTNFGLVKWDKSKYDRGIYLYKKNHDGERVIDCKEVIRRFNLSDAEQEILNTNMDILDGVYKDFIFHRSYLLKEEKRIISELQPLLHNHEEHECDEEITRNFVHSIRTRLKNPEHMVVKIIRKGSKYFQDQVEVIHSVVESSLAPDNYMSIITDLIGVRVLHLFKDNWLQIDSQLTKLYGERIVEKKFYVRKGDEIHGQDDLQKEVEQKGFEFLEKESGYRSAHYLIKRDVYVDSGDMFTTYAEIQVRTVFEEAWGEVDHEIRYPHYDKNKNINHFLKTFNRIVGSADEMATYIKAYRDSLTPTDTQV